MSAPPVSLATPGESREAAIGLASGLTAFLIWGVVPLYFKALAMAGPLEIVAHRVVWTVLLLTALVLALGREREALLVLFSRRVGVYMLSTALVSTNWLLFIWAVVNDHVLDASFGYYINPLVNVLLGVVFLGERLNRWQLAAVGLAGIAVGNLIVGYGAVPWVALGLAFSFGFYALVRKMAHSDPLIGLVVETSLLAVPALAFLLWLEARGGGTFIAGGVVPSLLLVGSGVVTALPLLLFMHGARRLTLSTIGLMQYVAPTLQFLSAVLAFGEPFTRAHLISFSLIWIGLAIYSGDAVAHHRRRGATQRHSPAR